MMLPEMRVILYWRHSKETTLNAPNLSIFLFYLDYNKMDYFGIDQSIFASSPCATKETNKDTQKNAQESVLVAESLNGGEEKRFKHPLSFKGSIVSVWQSLVNDKTQDKSVYSISSKATARIDSYIIQVGKGIIEKALLSCEGDKRSTLLSRDIDYANGNIKKSSPTRKTSPSRAKEPQLDHIVIGKVERMIRSHLSSSQRLSSSAAESLAIILELLIKRILTKAVSKLKSSQKTRLDVDMIII